MIWTACSLRLYFCGDGHGVTKSWSCWGISTSSSSHGMTAELHPGGVLLGLFLVMTGCVATTASLSGGFCAVVGMALSIA
eukprot:11913094-Ditylum_brightwellii.AAC.1